MGFTARRGYQRVWSPNADAVNAAPTVLLRGDNLILDELGAVALRLGSSKINGSPLADTDIHSLFTTPIGGTRYRMAGAGSSVYANGSSILSGVAGSNDIAFGFHNGQVLIGRSTTKKKYDGTTVRNWGIAMTGTKPSAVGVPPDGKTFSTGASTEIFPAWVPLEAAVLGVTNYGPNHYEVADPLYNATGAVILTMAATNRCTYWMLRPTPADFTTYDAGRRGTDDDIISCFVWVSDPNLLKDFSFQVDVNDGRFTKDWYQAPPVDASLLHQPVSDDTQVNAPLYRPRPGIVPVPFQPGHARAVQPTGSSSSGGTAVDSSGWMQVKWRRGDFTRIGTTAGKDWATVKGLRLVAHSTEPNLTLRVDTIRISGGALVGQAQWRYVYVRNASGHIAKSAPSPASDVVIFANQDAQISIPADSSRDSQVNEIWVYREDQEMQTYYRVKVNTGISGTSGVMFTDGLTSADAIDLNIILELDNLVPPDNIIAIVGPHFDRTLALTSDGVLWPSRKLDPDAFSAGQAITVAGKDETALWMFRALSDVFIGTTKDIYRLEGTGAEQPDASIDYILRPLSMDHYPLNAAVAHEGNQVVFFADDGWRATEGSGTSLLTADTSLLYRGEARHGVSAVNVAAGRFRAVLGKGQLIAISPEGSETDSSRTLYRLVFSGGLWYRHTYPTAGHWRSLHREPDGTIIAGDDAGTVWILDSGTDDAGSAIPVVLWTKVDDLDLTYQRKKLGDLTWRSDTGGVATTVAVHLNGASGAAASFTATQTGEGTTAVDLANAASASAVAICKQVQFRLTGSVTTFRFYDFGLQFRERPAPMIGRVVEGWSGSPGVKILSGYLLKCNTLGAARIITPLLDGVADAETFSITTSTEEPETHTLRFTLRGRRAIDIAFAVDGELEIDSWSPIVTQRQPLGVKVWDSGPIMDAEKELVWLRELQFKVRAEADLLVTPYFDGTAFPSVSIKVTPDVDTVYRIPVGRSYVGRQPRIVVTSCDVFYPYFVRAIRRGSGSPSEKDKVMAAMPLETAGQ